MERVISVEVMRHSDAMTIQNNIPSKELMYRAGEAIFGAYEWKGKTAIICGSGNNAGDGYVLASLLQKAEIPCSVILLFDKFSADGRYYFEKCKEIGVEILPYTSKFDFSSYTEIVDCIFGTGFSGEVTGICKDAIEQINRSEKFVISVDINSGLNGNNGLGSCCVKSDLTLSIGYYQYGHFLGNAKDAMKKKQNLDIGIDLYGESAYLARAEAFCDVLKDRAQASHKGIYGYVALIGGCREYSGAVKLANMSCAALRSGCGVATLAVPDSILNSVAPYLLESTAFGLPDCEGHMRFDPVALDRLLQNKSAVAIGMGWGKNAENARILAHLLQNYDLPTVIDADGLNTLAEMDQAVLKTTKCKVLLTPHLKEFSRLSGYTMEEIANDPIGTARSYAKQYGVCLLLKGACTVVTDGDEVILVDRGCAGMATAGSGDVLSGILVGLLGYSSVTPTTAACGAYIAGLAGELAQSEENEISMIASDTVRCISKAIAQIKKYF